MDIGHLGHRWTRGAMDGPSLEMLKVRLGGTLGSLVWWEVPMVRGLELGGL